MWVMKYEGECIKTMECVEFLKSCIKSKQKNTYLSVPGDFDWKKPNYSDALPLPFIVSYSEECTAQT